MSATHHFVLGTAGHIDHGKTALVKALTGVDTDRLPAEKQRGITIDLGFAALDLGATHLAVVDVPGHERFIRNMLAGATGLDLALLVVAADDSVMPQTREHLDILRLLGLGGGVVAITKCDLVEPAWLDLVEDEIRRLTRGTFLESAAIVRTSAATGQGIDALRLALAQAAAAAGPRADLGVFRLAIDRVFTLAGLGAVVTGTVSSGAVGVGDDVELWPPGRVVRVRGLEQHDQAVERIARGSRAAINLSGAHHREIARGHELAAPGFLTPTRLLSVHLAALADTPQALKHRGRYRLHMGTRQVAAAVSLLKGSQIEAGQEGLAQLLLAEEIVAVAGQPLVLRQESPAHTLCGGRVLEVGARRIRRRDREVVDRLAALVDTPASRRAAAAIARFGLRPWTDLDLCREAGLPRSEVAAMLGRLRDEGELVPLSLGPRREILVARDYVAQLEERLLRALERLHDARPRQTVIPRNHLAAELPGLDHDAAIPAVVARLIAQGRVIGDSRTLALASRTPRLTERERKLKESLEAAIAAGRFAPPDQAELTSGAGTLAAVVPELLELLVDEERLVAIGPGFFVSLETATALEHDVREHLATAQTMTMAALRDVLGTSRKYAVPIGEYLDRIGLTRREGDVRRLAVPLSGSGPSPTEGGPAR